MMFEKLLHRVVVLDVWKAQEYMAGRLTHDQAYEINKFVERMTQFIADGKVASK